MPGLLRPDAVCPLCEEPLVGLVDQTNSDGVKRTYYHGKSHPKRRRALPCKQTFVSHVRAAIERQSLEVRAA